MQMEQENSQLAPTPPSPAKGGVGLARLAILLSGRGSNMLALAEAVRTGVLRGVAEIAVVFSNDPAAPGLDAAAALGLPTASLLSKGRKREEFDREVVYDTAG